MAKEPVPKDKHKARMIDIAVDILAREGLQALQARRVAQDCGCSVGTLYNTFDGLDDLIVQANARTLDRLKNHLESAVSPDQPAEQRLMGLAIAYMSFALQNQTAWRAIFEHRTTDHWTAPEWYIEQQNALLDMLEPPLTALVGHHASRRRGARALFSAVHGILVLATDRKLGPPDVAEIEAQVRFVVAATSEALPRLIGKAAGH